VFDIVVLQDFIQLSVAEVRTSITYQDSWDTESREYVLLEKFDYCLSIISGGGSSFHPFADIIYNQQDILLVK